MSSDRYAVVTGATKGIGRAIAERFLKEGYCVIGNYAHDDAAAGAMEREAEAHRENLRLIKLDLCGAEAGRELARRVRRMTNGVDVLVCNSGTTDTTPFPQITEAGWSRVMDVNVTAPLFLTQELTEDLRKKRGDVVFISSILGGGYASCALGQLWRQQDHGAGIGRGAGADAAAAGRRGRLHCARVY